jgi:uncharacterized protein YegL
MNSSLTEIVFILDRSGSMSGLEKDTIGGFNSMMERQKNEEGEALVSTVLFDNISTVLHDRVKLEDVKPLTTKDYYVGGCTALLDAVGGAVHHISNVHRYIREEDRPAKTVFVITTDGMENASRKYSRAKVREMIEEKQTEGWTFIFLGANIDAAVEAEGIGIGRENSVDYMTDREGTEICYRSIGRVVSSVRRREAISRDWGEESRKYSERKKRS